MHPVVRVQGDGAARRGQGLRPPAGADEQKSQRGVRIRQPLIQLDGAVRMEQRRLQTGPVGPVRRTRQLVDRVLGVGESRIGQGVALIQGDRPCEGLDRGGELPCVERLQQHVAFGPCAVGVEARRLPRDELTGVDREIEADGELPDDLILDLEDRVEQAIRLRRRHGVARLRLDDAGGDTQAVRDPLVAARDDQIGLDRRRNVEGRPVNIAGGLDDPPAVDHLYSVERPQIVRHGFGDPGSQPGVRVIAGEVREVHDGDGAAGGA